MFTKLVRAVPALLLLLAASLATANAHQTNSFSACAAYRKHDRMCLDNATFTPYAYSTVFLRGRVKPVHSDDEAKVQRKKPGSAVWKTVATVAINAQGKMKWSWALDESDVDYDGPYRLRFRIPNHGRSNPVKVWVIYGE